MAVVPQAGLSPTGDTTRHAPSALSPDPRTNSLLISALSKRKKTSRAWGVYMQAHDDADFICDTDFRARGNPDLVRVSRTVRRARVIPQPCPCPCRRCCLDLDGRPAGLSNAVFWLLDARTGIARAWRSSPSPFRAPSPVLSTRSPVRRDDTCTLQDDNALRLVRTGFQAPCCRSLLTAYPGQQCCFEFKGPLYRHVAGAVHSDNHSA